MPEYLTQSQYAKRRHCSKAAVRKAVLSGRITLGADGLLDPEIADAQWLQNTVARVGSRPGRAAAQTPEAAPAPPADPAPYDESRARREQAEAGLAELALGEAAGRLLARDRVELGVFHAARALRDQLSNSSAQLGAAVAGLTSAGECEQAIRSAHRQLLDDFVRELGRMIGPPAAEPAPAA